MNLHDWNHRYRTGERRAEDIDADPTPLVVSAAGRLPPGRALDLACGAGRNALYLASCGWQVTAVDGAGAAIEILRERARERGLNLDARVADLESAQFQIELETWDLICDCYYLQRDLLPLMRGGVRPGGIVIVIVHLADPGEPAAPTRAVPGELRRLFADWQILHYYEGAPADAAHKRAVAELVARRPAQNTC